MTIIIYLCMLLQQLEKKGKEGKVIVNFQHVTNPLTFSASPDSSYEGFDEDDKEYKSVLRSYRSNP